MEMDLTQTSFSTIPSIDIELGDKASSHSTETLNQLGDGLTAGINAFFGFYAGSAVSFHKSWYLWQKQRFFQHFLLTGR